MLSGKGLFIFNLIKTRKIEKYKICDMSKIQAWKVWLNTNMLQNKLAIGKLFKIYRPKNGIYQNQPLDKLQKIFVNFSGTG